MVRGRGGWGSEEPTGAGVGVQEERARLSLWVDGVPPEGPLWVGSPVQQRSEDSGLGTQAEPGEEASPCTAW